MAGDDTGKARMPLAENTPGPDVMLGLWASWMDRMSDLGAGVWQEDRPWWQMTADDPLPDVLTGAAKQFQESLSKDPTLRSIDQVWNANPLREVVPVDWAEITRALRIVWLRSLGKPRAAQAVVDFNQDLWRSALQIWQEAGQRWLGLAGLFVGRRAVCRLAGQAVRRARVAHEPRLSHPQGGLPSRIGLAAEAVRRGRRPGRGRAAAHQLPSAPVRGRHEPDPDADVEPHRPSQGD